MNEHFSTDIFDKNSLKKNVLYENLGMRSEQHV